MLQTRKIIEMQIGSKFQFYCSSGCMLGDSVFNLNGRGPSLMHADKAEIGIPAFNSLDLGNRIMVAQV